MSVGIMRKIRRLAYELFPSGALGGSLGASRKEAQARRLSIRRWANFSAQEREIVLYYRLDNLTALRSSHCWRRVGVRSVADKSEKLAQEGLRRDRDRLAVGERVRAGVRKVSHDLKGVRGTEGFLRQYQTDRWVRMVNTKLTDRSEWYYQFHNPAGDRALSFSRLQLSGGCEGGRRNGRHNEVL